MSTEHDAAPAVSDEARRLIGELRLASWEAGSRPFEQQPETIKGDIAAETSAEDALLAYVAGLEAEVARLRDLASGAAFHFFCCGPGIHTEEDDCGQFVPALADLAKAIGFDADPATNAEIAAVPQSQATKRRAALAAQEKPHAP